MKTVKLCDICDVRDGTHDSPSYYSDGYPFITTKNLVNGTIDFSTASLICEEDFRHFDKRSHVDDGDILMPMIGTIGGAIIVNKDREFAIKNVALIKKDKESIDFNFLLHVLNSNKMLTYFEQFKTGGTQKFISLNFIRNLPIPEKSLPEQKKIASHLDSIQSAIDNKKQQLQQLDELVKSKFVEMFGENPVESGKWKVEKLGDVANIKIGPFGSLLHKQDYITNGHCLINPSHIIKGKIVVDPELSVSDEKYMELESYQLQPDDIVLGRRGEMGRCAVVYEKGFLCGTGSMIIRPNGKLKSYFLNHILSSDTTKSYLEENAIGVTMKNINEPLVKSICVPIIPIELQNTFAEYVQKIDSAKSIIKTQLVDLQELLDSKMDEYFGE